HTYTLSLHDALPISLVALARIYLKRDEAQTALPYAEKAVKLSPGDFTAHVALGQALLATGDVAGAARELESSVKLAPATPAAHRSEEHTSELQSRFD